MKVNDLRCFIAVADELHFGRAATRLLYTTSHVSQRVRALERELGVRLFDRTTREVALTVAGAALLDHARPVLEGFDALHDIDTWSPRSDQALRIAFSPGVGGVVTQLLHLLTESAAGASVRIDPYPSSPAVDTAVESGEADFGITQWVTPRLDSTLIQDADLCLLVPCDHRLAGAPEVSAHDLHGEPLLLPERRINPAQFDATTDFFTDHGIAPAYRPRNITSTQTIVDLVTLDQGVAITMADNVALTNADEVTAVPVTGPWPPTNSIHLVWYEGASHPLFGLVIELVNKIAAR